MRSLLLSFLSMLLFLGCTTDMKKQFQQVKVGMEKNDVLGLMDSPQRTQRWHGMDRWTYIYYSDDMREEKEVHFQNGIANYVGESFKPEISADEQDHRNDQANVELEKTLKIRRQEIQNSITTDYPAQPNIKSSVPQFVPVQ